MPFASDSEHWQLMYLYVHDVQLPQCIDMKLLSSSAGTIKLIVKYSPKILEEMEYRFEHTKSFKRGGRASARH